jgi:hypothetical protein
MRLIILILLTLALSLNGTSQRRLDLSFPKKSAVTSIQTKLNIPFGTIAKLKVEIYDGDSVKMFAYQSRYLLKVNSVNGKVVRDTLLLKFIDESKTLANDDDDLSTLTYCKIIDSLTDNQVYEMKKKYVGKKFTIMAYETGRFTGTPEKYFDYEPIVPGIPHFFATRGFLFEHYLVIVSNLTNKK